jgi:hypothetical protein
VDPETPEHRTCRKPEFSGGSDQFSAKPVIRPHDKFRDSSELLDERIALESTAENDPAARMVSLDPQVVLKK